MDLDSKDLPFTAKTSKTESVALESGAAVAQSANIKTATSHNRTSSYPEPGVEAATSTRSLQVHRMN